MNDIITACSLCRACAGSAYQTPPVLMTGRQDAPVVVVAQNPGEIKAGSERELFAKAFAEYVDRPGESPSADVINFWYGADFGTSNGAAQMARIFGEGWLRSGYYLYTNAVRCRTPKNEMPSKEMTTGCSVWTRQLLLRKETRAVIMLGGVAKSQVLAGDETKLPNEVVKTHPRYGMVLAIPHYVAWKTDKIDDYKSLVETILGKLR